VYRVPTQGFWICFFCNNFKIKNGLTWKDGSGMQEVEEMVEEADVNNDGQVNYTSLVPVLNVTTTFSLNRLSYFFKLIIEG
jgi:hypothetical protein